MTIMMVEPQISDIITGGDPHVTIALDALDFTSSHQMSALMGAPIWPLPMMHWTSPYKDPLALTMLVTSSGQDWQPVKIVLH